MPVWGALVATLGWNYMRHRQHKSTLCSAGRKHVPGWAMTLAWCFLSGWLVPHYVDGFKIDLRDLTD